MNAFSSAVQFLIRGFHEYWSPSTPKYQNDPMDVETCPEKHAEYALDNESHKDEQMDVDSDSNESDELCEETHQREQEVKDQERLRCLETEPFYPKKLFFKNVAPCVSTEFLVNYLKNITGQDCVDLLYSNEPGGVLATFKTELYFAKVKKKCQKKLLNKRHLEVWRVPVSNSILVENLSPNTDPNHVSCYFETPRAKGGTVLAVKQVRDRTKCVVFFEDKKATEGVLKATHRLGGRKLRVSLYLECLGPSGGRTEPYIFVPPPPVEVTEADDLKVCFLRHSADILQSFNESLSEVHGQATVEGHVLRVDCTLTGSMYRVDLMAGRWRENVKRQLTICFDSIRLQRIAVHPEIWENVKKAVEESEVSCSDLILTFVEEHSFVVLGRRNTKTVAFEQIQSIIKVKTEECELKKLEVSDTKKVRKHHLELVKSSSFLSDIRTLHTGLTVDISLEHGEITLQGQPMAILDAQVRMYDLIHSFSTKVVTSIPQAQRDLLATEKSHEAVMKRLEANGLTAAWECHSEAIVVYNLNKHWLDPAAGIIETSFKSEILFFNKLSSRAFEESQWDSQKKMLVREYHGLLEISRQKSSIFITAFCDIMPAVKGAVRAFISENTIYTAVLELSPSRQKYLALFWEEKILPTAQKFAQYKVHITLQDDNRSILIRGTYKGVELVKDEFISLSDQIICKEESITRPETVRYIAALKTTKELEAIACTCKCVVSLHPEKCEIKTLSTNQPSGSPQVYAVTGDITQLAVDAVVNAANSLMDHAGGLAGQVVAKGGQEIQEECYRILKTRGKLSEGDVLVSGPGKLPCKSIIHAVGPRYKGGNKGEEECLQATVMECLKTASDLGYTSIAFPAISSGIFGYPVREATRVIVEAVTSFLGANHDTSIRDVRLVDIVTSTVRHFQTALYTIQKRNKFFPNQQAAWTIRDAVAEGMLTTMSPNQPCDSPNIKAVIADITQLSVDAIVNAANEEMNHAGGLAGQVVAKGGQEIQEECSRILRVKGKLSEGDVLVSGPGKLPCKSIIHAVGPRYKGGNKGEEECLQATVLECLKTATDLGYTSIAFPAISSGIFGYPVREATRVIVEAVRSFFSTNTDSSIIDVRLVDILPRTIQDFEKALEGASNQQMSTDLKSGSPGLVLVTPGGEHKKRTIVPTIIRDINLLNVDAVLIAVNTGMFHFGDIAKIREIKEECQESLKTKGELSEGDVLVLGPGKLPFKSIIHAVGPRLKDGDEGEEEWIRATVTRYLETASDRGYTSIALPAISSRVFGYSVETSVRVIVDTLKAFFNINHDSSVIDVRLIDGFSHNVQEFERVLSSGSLESNPLPAASPEPSIAPGAASSEPSDRTILSNNQSSESQSEAGVATQQTDGATENPVNEATSHTDGPARNASMIALAVDITQLNVDAIVNPINKDLDISYRVAKRVVETGGTEIQEECRRLLEDMGELSEGDVLVSGPGKLRCKSIIHVVIPTNAEDDKVEESMLTIVVKCLETASERGYTSIALPLLTSNTWVFTYTDKLAARATVKAVRGFLAMYPDSSIKNVTFCDTRSEAVTEFRASITDSLVVEQGFDFQTAGTLGTCRAVDDEACLTHSSQWPTISTHWTYGATRPKLNAENVTPPMIGATVFGKTANTSLSPGTLFGTSAATPGPQANVQGLNFGDIHVTIKQGDITEEDTEAIVNSTNSKMDFTRGAVSIALRTKCGPELEQMCEAKLSEMAERKVVVTEACKLRSRYILHIDAEHYRTPGNWEDAYIDILKEAESIGLKYIALPAIGTGGLGLSFTESARALGRALITHSRDTKAATSVTVVLFDAATIGDFKDTLTQVGATWKAAEAMGLQWPCVSERLYPIFGTGEEIADQIQARTVPKVFKLHIFSANQDKRVKLQEALNRFVDGQVVETKVQDSDVLPPEKLMKLCQKHDVRLLKTDTGDTVKGLPENVRLLLTEQRLMVETRKREQQESLTANLVQWYYAKGTATGTTRIPYRSRENLMIESAYQAKKKFVELVDANGTVYIVNFEKKKDYAKMDPTNSVRIMRKEMVADWTSSVTYLPETWEPHDEGHFFKRVALAKASLEYKSVEDNMTETAGRTFTVLSIERIQNPDLYKQYLAKKTQMNIQNKEMPLEKTLWHGTSADTVDDINNYGFNRSFCGKNATNYGQGVYFAVRSCYSMHDTYSTQGFEGRKHMYQCKVLVGHSTQGSPSMKVLPKRDGKVRFDSATDGVLNPEMYIIFSDTQAYPEYLVTFQW